MPYYELVVFVHVAEVQYWMSSFTLVVNVGDPFVPGDNRRCANSLHWRHNDHDSVPNHQPHGCLLNRLFRRRSKKTSKLHVTSLCVGIHRDRWIPRTKGQLCEKCFHLMTSSCYGYNTRHGPFNTYAKYHCSKSGYTVVMTIWNIDAWQRQKYLIPAESCYFMSFSNKVSYLLYSIMLLSQIIATMISTVRFGRNNIPFTIEDILKGEFKWNITSPCYAINTRILYRLCFLWEDLIGYTHANVHHDTTFSCRNIAFQIWWLPCNPHRSKWPKTFCGRYMCIYIYCELISALLRDEIPIECKLLTCSLTFVGYQCSM